MDMGTLMYNLISNGIEACMESGPERELELVVREEEGTTEIFMENTISGSVMRDNPKLESRKPEKRYHGFGMESIREIIHKYQGCYSYREESGRFIQEISLREVSE
ncbi:MAG: GHKL domain-containing protein [Clostridia bacterium]|nr:GHKL domain-containing protein [Clostridia bacterium]